MHKKITLENGLRIVLASKEESFSTTTLVLVGAGSEYETKETNGISHFLEHLCFKGTKNRPTSFDITSELDHIGAVYNAFTGTEYTGYFAKATPEHLDKIIDIISDMYLNPLIPPSEIEKERGVIIEEINYYEDTPMRKVQELFTNLLYKDQPAGWDIAGRKEIIKKLQREDFLRYRDLYYLSKNTLVVIAGSFNEKNVVEILKDKFKDIKEGFKKEKPITIESQSKPEVLIKTKDLDQTHIVLGVRAYNLFDKRRFSLELLSNILGGGMSSRLFQRIREELGACYYINAGANLSIDHGYLAVSAGIDNRRVEEIIVAVLQEINKIKNELVSDKELIRAKNCLIGNMYLGLESSDELASFYGSQEIIKNKIMEPEEIKIKIESVTADEIKEVAQDIFKNNKLNLALIGPVKDQEKIEKILTF